MASNWTRRAVLSGAAAVGTTLIVKPALAAEYRFSQYHNQAASGTLHKNLIAMWQAVAAETNGRVETTVYPENNKLPGGDPDALKMLIAGEIQFFTLMGGIIGTVVPVAEAQQLPFAFKRPKRTRRSMARLENISARRWRPRACTCSRSPASTTACGRSPPSRGLSQPRKISPA
jgi:TRAP-type C4-dicarboxylate transport system substrate-binding protein